VMVVEWCRAADAPAPKARAGESLSPQSVLAQNWVPPSSILGGADGEAVQPPSSSPPARTLPLPPHPQPSLHTTHRGLDGRGARGAPCLRVHLDQRCAVRVHHRELRVIRGVEGRSQDGPVLLQRADDLRRGTRVCVWGGVRRDGVGEGWGRGASMEQPAAPPLGLIHHLS